MLSRLLHGIKLRLLGFGAVENGAQAGKMTHRIEKESGILFECATNSPTTLSFAQVIEAECYFAFQTRVEFFWKQVQNLGSTPLDTILLKASLRQRCT